MRGRRGGFPAGLHFDGRCGNLLAVPAHIHPRHVKWPSEECGSDAERDPETGSEQAFVGQVPQPPIISAASELVPMPFAPTSEPASDPQWKIVLHFYVR